MHRSRIIFQGILTLLLLTVLVPLPSALAQTQLDLTLLGAAPLDAREDKVAIAGLRMYVGRTQLAPDQQRLIGILDVVDVARPTNPVRLQRLSIDGGVYAIALAENLMLVTSQKALHVFSRTSPQGYLTLRGSYQIEPPGIITTALPRVALVGQRAYVVVDDVGDGSRARLEIFDLSNLTQVTRLGSVPGFFFSMTVQEDRVYSVQYPEGSLRIHDVSDPAQVQLVKTISGLGIGEPLAISGTLLYAGTSDAQGGTTQLRIIDLANSDAPVVRGSFGPVNTRDPISLANGYVVARENRFQVNIFDTRNATQPLLVGRYEAADFEPFVFVPAAIVGSRLYIPGTVYDLAANPVFPPIKGYETRVFRLSGGGLDEQPVSAAPLTTPPPNAGSPIVRLQWPTVTRAQYYELQIRDEGVPDGSPVAAATLASYTLVEQNFVLIAAPGNYIYQVRGCNDLGCGPYSQPQAFQVTSAAQNTAVPLIVR